MAMIESNARRFDLRSPTSFTQADLLGLLGKGLKNVYEATAEPLPDDLTKIVERLKQQERTLTSSVEQPRVALRPFGPAAGPFPRAA